MVVSEAFRNAFQKIDPDRYGEWGNKGGRLRTEILPAFIEEFVQWNGYFSGKVQVLDCAMINLETVSSIAKEGDIVVCLGFGGSAETGIISTIRKYAGEEDYTRNYTDQQLLQLWGAISKTDQNNIVLCEKFGYKHFDTSIERGLVIENVVKYVCDQIDRINKK